MSLSAGDTFILHRETRGTPHLWVLLWGPAGPAAAFLAVHLASYKPGRDRTCIITPGEHPFIQWDTYVVYNAPKRLTEASLREAMRERHAFQKDPVTPQLLTRLRTGLFTSAFTPHDFIEMARDVFGRP